jgi:hypothetical protein
MRFATVWDYCEQQLLQNMTQEVLCISTVLLSRQIDHVESTDSPNNSQHEALRPGLLLHRLRDIISQYAPFRIMMKFQSERTLVLSYKSLKLILLVSRENGQ